MLSHVFRSPLPDVEIPDIPLTQYVLQRADQMPDKLALVDGLTGRSYTYGQLADHISRLAGGLSNLGFGPGSVLAILAPNIPEYAIVFHAAALAGGTVTTINPAYGEDEVRHQLNDSGATMIVTVPDFVAAAQSCLEGTPATEVAVIGEPSFDDLYGDPIKQVEIDLATSVVVLPYSSGTTGLSKGVKLSHQNLVANLVQSQAVLGYQADDVALAVLPFFHIYGMQLLMNGLLAEGVTIVTMPRFDMAKALELVETHRVSQFFAVPPIVLGLAKSPLVDKFDLSSLTRVFCGAAPLGGEVAEEASQRVGCAVVQGYGMTELSPVTHATKGLESKVGSSGITVPNTQCRVVDPMGNDLGADAVGELWVRGPQVMLGYLNNDSATAETIDDEGWLHTGDVARIDSDGHMFIVDRVKELIKYKGFQVPPAELEALILTHPSVADVAVIGVEDIEAGELPKAFVVLKPGTECGAEAIKTFVANEVASYKQIRMVEFIEDIPKSASGKILRRLLRERSA